MKNKTLNFIKLICAFLVVFIHIPFPDTFGDIITAISRMAVPFFFISAGYFSNNISKEKTINRVKHLIKIFVGSYILYFIYNYLSLSLTETTTLLSFLQKTFNINNIVLFLFFNNISVSSHLWFLPALIYCYIINYLLGTKLKLQKIFPFLCLILLCIGIFLSEIFTIINVNFHYICIRNFLIVGFPYFLLGVIFNQYKITISNTKAYILLIVGMILSVLSSLILQANLEIYLGSLLSSFALFSIAINKNTNGTTKIIENIGTISTLIYIIHPLIIHLSKDLIKILNIQNNILYQYSAPILTCIISTIFACLITILLNKNNKRL